MRAGWSSGNGGERLEQARADHARDEVVQQAKAVRTVDSQAIDSVDRAMLMAMLGLDTPAGNTVTSGYADRLV